MDDPWAWKLPNDFGQQHLRQDLRDVSRARRAQNLIRSPKSFSATRGPQIWTVQHLPLVPAYALGACCPDWSRWCCTWTSNLNLPFLGTATVLLPRANRTNLELLFASNWIVRKVHVLFWSVCANRVKQSVTNALNGGHRTLSVGWSTCIRIKKRKLSTDY